MNYNISILVFLLGAYADFATTRIGFRNNFTEGNPIVRFILNKLPWDSEIEIEGIKIVAFAAMLLMVAPAWMFYGIGGGQLLVAYLNFRKLRAKKLL